MSNLCLYGCRKRTGATDIWVVTDRIVVCIDMYYYRPSMFFLSLASFSFIAEAVIQILTFAFPGLNLTCLDLADRRVTMIQQSHHILIQGLGWVYIYIYNYNNV